MYDEDDLLPLSALQHLLFCERQCALMHIEQVWDENRLTMEGRILHERVHESGDESRGNVRIVRGLRLRSRQLGLSGMADVVEFHRAEDGAWIPFPVEYKRGKPKADPCDAVQLCAQAICLEEMLSVAVPAGALFYGATRRREDVAFDAELRRLTEETARRLHSFLEARVTPPPVLLPRCDNCSLKELCLPKGVGARSVARYIQRILAEAKEA